MLTATWYREEKHLLDIVVIGPDDQYFHVMKLHETPANEISAKRTRTSFLAPTLLIATGLIMPFLLIVFCVKPFQLATGTLSSSGSLDWFAGETILAMSWSVMYILLGVVAIRVIRNGYSPLSQVRPEPAENDIKE